jgi:multiple sugar transport system substrate-binding protein
MKKRILAAFLSLTVVSSVLAGCSSSVASSSGSAADMKSAANVAASSKSSRGDKVTLTVWNEPDSNDDLNMYLQAKKATGITVDVTVIPESDYSSKLNQMISTGDSSADIYVVWENDLRNFAQSNGIIPLDDYLKKSSIKTDDFIGAVSKLSEGLGHTYGLPWCAATELLYYNRDMFKAANISLPTNDWSYANFLAAAKKLTQKGKVYGCTLPNTQTWWAGIGGAGDQIYDPSNGYMVIGDGAVSFVTDCYNMVKAGVMPAPSSDTADLFAAGKAAMSWQGSWTIGTYADKLNFDWDIATLPVNKVKYNTLHTGFYTINSKSKNKDAAFKVIEYLMGEEGQTINSKSSGNPSAIKSIADEGAWKVDGAKTIKNWNAVTDSLAAGTFGYVCLPSGVTNNAVSEFNAALQGQKTPKKAVEKASQYAKETIGY